MRLKKFVWIFALLVSVFLLTSVSAEKMWNFNNHTVNISDDLYVGGTIYGTINGAGNSLWKESGDYLYPRNLSKNIGIGTNTPDSDLHILSGSAAINIESSGVGTPSRLYLTPQGTLSSLNERFSMENYGNLFQLRTFDGLLSTSLLSVNNDGEVGIGTTNPRYNLEITGDTSDEYMFHIGDGELGIMSLGGNDRGEFIVAGGRQFNGDYSTSYASEIRGSLGSIEFYTVSGVTGGTTYNPPERMKLDNLGRLGINTSTPQNTLNVVGDLNVTGIIYGGSFSGGVDADTLDSLDSLQFLRSDVDDTMAANLLINPGQLTVSDGSGGGSNGSIYFGDDANDYIKKTEGSDRIGLFLDGVETFYSQSGGNAVFTGDVRADNFMIDTSTVINDAVLTINDASRYIWTPASGWGEYWDTTNNQIDFMGGGVERGYIDLDNGNAQFDGSVTANRGIFTGTSWSNSPVWLYNTDTMIWMYETDNSNYGWSIDIDSGNFRITDRTLGSTRIGMDELGNFDIVSGDLSVGGGRVTGSNSEYISIGESNSIIEFQGAGGTTNQDIAFDLDGSNPVIYSPTDTYIQFNDNLYLNSYDIDGVGSLEIINGPSIYESSDRADLLAVRGIGGSWQGFQIDSSSTSKWSFMGDQDDLGIYDDYNGEWILYYNENADVSLYYDGSSKLTTTSQGITVKDNVTAAGYYHSSDRKLKTNIVSLESSLEKIKKLEPVSFDWKKGGSSIGLVAQDIETIYPELVGSNSIHNETTNETNTYKTIQYGNLVAPLIGAVQELDESDSMLEEKICEQEKKIEELEKELVELKKLILEKEKDLLN